MSEQQNGPRTIDLVDARLLTDAIKELNISKKNVGLYPRDHPLTKESMAKAFSFLQKLFESRGNITLGIARDTIIIDEAVLDKKSTVLKEFALGLHTKGIAAITLYSTLTIEDLFCFHELITEKNAPMGPALIELAEQKGLRDIKLVSLDLSKFKFVSGITRKDGADNTFWDEYISGLLEGRLSDEDIDEIIDRASPEEIADAINKNLSEDSAEKTCEAVIQSYMGRGGSEERRAALFGKFLSLVDNLSPGLKRQFLSRSFSSASINPGMVKQLLRQLRFKDIEKMVAVFDEQSSLLPEKLKNLVDRLKLTKNDIFAEIRGSRTTCMDDIEIDETMVRSFRGALDSKFVDERYSEELRKMMESPRIRSSYMTDELAEACEGEIVDSTVSIIMFELLGAESNSSEEYAKLLANLADFANGFIETGRFSRITEIYNIVYSHSLTGKFREQASEMIKSFFGSGVFVLRLVEAFKIWGKHDKEGVINLAIILKEHLVSPLLDALAEEQNAPFRRFLLDVLCRVGSDVVPEAAKRLDDSRWYVTRNMLYLLSKFNGSEYSKQIRRHTKHQDIRVALEAVKTLLHFRTPDSISYIRHYLDSKDPLLREQAILLAGTYQVKEAVPYLIELLEKKDLFGTKSYNKDSVVHVLGEIGDPAALKTLNKIYESNALLNRAELEKLKTAIFKSLHHYPFQYAKQLLENGLKSKIGEIRSISEKLLKDSGKNDCGKDI